MNPYRDKNGEIWWEVTPDQFIKQHSFIDASNSYGEGDLRGIRKEALESLAGPLRPHDGQHVTLRNFVVRNGDHPGHEIATETRPFHVVFGHSNRDGATRESVDHGRHYGGALDEGFLKRWRCVSVEYFRPSEVPFFEEPRAERRLPRPTALKSEEEPVQPTAHEADLEAMRHRLADSIRKAIEEANRQAMRIRDVAPMARRTDRHGVEWCEFEENRWFCGEPTRAAENYLEHREDRSSFGRTTESIDFVDVINPVAKVEGTPAASVVKDVPEDQRRIIARVNADAESVDNIMPLRARQDRQGKTWYEYEENRWLNSQGDGDERVAAQLYFENRASPWYGRKQEDLGLVEDQPVDVEDSLRAMVERKNRVTDSVEHIKPLKARPGVGSKTWYEYEDDRWFAADHGGGERGAAKIYFDNREDRRVWGQRGRLVVREEKPVPAPETPAETPKTTPLGTKLRWFQDKDNDEWVLLSGTYMTSDWDIESEDDAIKEFEEKVVEGDEDEYDNLEYILRSWGPLREIVEASDGDGDRVLGPPLTTVDEVLRGRVMVMDESAPEMQVQSGEQKITVTFSTEETPPETTEAERAPITFETIERGSVKATGRARKIEDRTRDAWWEIRYDQFVMSDSMSNALADNQTKQGRVGRSREWIARTFGIHSEETTLYPLAGLSENEQFVKSRVATLVKPGWCTCPAGPATFHYEDETYCSGCGKKRE
jgi:hypothetical protein